jgi:hypothetical protein
MRQKLLLFPLVAALFACHKNKDVQQPPIANNKALAWIKTYGGSNYDFANSVLQLSNGSYVIAGATRSTDGDIAGTRVGYDAWLAKVDNTGNKIWSMTYGTSNDEYANAVVPTPEGGLLMVGYTFVNNQNFAWAIKTDGNGTLLWQKDLTQSNDAKPFSILATADGAYLIAGYTTAATKDGWVVKIDGSGNQLWAKTYGGSNEDYFTSIVKASDGGYALTGYSSSGDGDIQRGKGSYDGWALKIDDSGNKVWSMNYGGSDEDYLKSIVKTSDGGYLAAGYTRSGNGDIPLNKGGYDEWMIKLDASGNKQWVKTYGGINEEYVTTVVNTEDGGFLTIGYSNSTTGDVTRPNNNFSAWLLKLDNSGNKVTASTYGHTAGNDNFTNSIITTQDGGYMIAGYSFEDNRGYDAWLVKIDKL